MDVVNAAKSGMNGLGMKVGATGKAGTVVAKGSSAKVAIVGLGKAAGSGSFWSGTGWKLGLGLGLGAWGPLLKTAIGTLVVYKATPMLIKVLAKR
ncbi:MAG TPA: hypothetical protein HPP54_06285 [Nitrospinae bacterium]|nr:hypothetical protein [Nitrospinota bacterium]